MFSHNLFLTKLGHFPISRKKGFAKNGPEGKNNETFKVFPPAAKWTKNLANYICMYDFIFQGSSRNIDCHARKYAKNIR